MSNSAEMFLFLDLCCRICEVLMCRAAAGGRQRAGWPLNAAKRSCFCFLTGYNETFAKSSFTSNYKINYIDTGLYLFS